MAKRKKYSDPFYTDEMAEQGFREGEPTVEECLADCRQELLDIIENADRQKPTGRKLAATAARALFQIDIIERSNSPSFVFIATQELGAQRRQLQILKGRQKWAKS